MTTERDTTRIVRSWLEEGATDIPDRVLDLVLERLPATPQRRRSWLARRSMSMNNAVRLGIAAAAVLVVGVVVIGALPGTGQPGAGAAADPTSLSSPSPSAFPRAIPSSVGSARPGSSSVGSGPLAAGRYHIDLGLLAYASGGGGASSPGGTARVSFDVPEGWAGFGDWAIIKAGSGSSGELGMAPMTIESVFVDPCHWSGDARRRGAADWDRGRTAWGVAEGLWTTWTAGGGPGDPGLPGRAPTSPTATRPEAATLAGLDARYLEVRTPTDLDFATCDGGQYTLWVDAAGGQRYVDRPGALDRVWVLDVSGLAAGPPNRLLVVDLASQVGSSPTDLAEEQAIVDSMTIELLETP